ncbi:MULTISPECIES: lipase family protein [Streptomyces]|uniref:lipase family protein n=1 Tax=Streptomyces TaxID=1883 RepID=UPI0022492AE0|nr:lipase family protein [Streptomyces sp. JHD 1]MCX2971758.1 alpha/beta fold hydrolase [Streptomyces sp. JHD 1]
MQPRRRGRTAAAALALVSALALGLAAAPGARADDRPPFYEPPAALPAANGDVIRTEPAAFHLDPLRLTEADAHVDRIMYRSTDGAGDPVAVTGTLLTPERPWSGAGERPLVGYAVGTQGLGDSCAPSRQLAAGSEYEGLFVNGLLARGYAVVLTDYEGLGTPGTHTYVNRAVSGHAVLDALRAAQRLPGGRVPADGPVAVTGYSQGGAAAAAAAELAPAYAPELRLVGVALGAPPTDLHAVAENLDGSLYAGFLGYAVAGLAAGYDVDTDPYLNAEGRALLEESAELCTAEVVAAHAFTRTETLTANGKPLTEYLKEPRWRAIVDEQFIGAGTPRVPTLVTHSLLDDVIPYVLGRDLAADWCANGATVQFAPMLAPTHVGGAVASYPRVFAWLDDRFTDRPARSTC